MPVRVAEFLEGSVGRLFCTGALQEQEADRKVLIIPPFAEEMNKSRHVLAAISAKLADLGHSVLLPDLYGTGDSEGQFGEATLDIWRADLDVAIRRLDPGSELDLIGLRAGALLATDVATRYPVRTMTLLHPMVEGRQQLTQMLRLRLAGGMSGGGHKETTAQLKARLARGECLEIAGYGLSGQLAADLEKLSLSKARPSGVAEINWIELAPEADRPLMPVSQRVIDDWRANGVAINCTVLACDQFWATQEIVDCPQIVSETMKRFEN